MIVSLLFFQCVLSSDCLPHWRLPLPAAGCWSQRNGAVPKLCVLGGGWKSDSGKSGKPQFLFSGNSYQPLHSSPPNSFQDGCDYVCRSQNREEALAYRGVPSESLEEEPEERDDHLLPM